MTKYKDNPSDQPDLGLIDERPLVSEANGQKLTLEQRQALPKRLSKSTPKLSKSEEVKKRGSAKIPKTKDPKSRGLFFRLFMSLFWFGVGLTIFGLTIIFLCYAFFSQDLPSVDNLKNYAPKTVTYFYSSDGRVIGEYSHQRRLVKRLNEIPPILRQAFLATEDAPFYQHKGVNPMAIVRAAYNTIVDDRLQGASTITQQMVRSFFLSNERKISRKIKEIILSFRVESVLNKDQIFEIYLNQIYLGQGAYGVEAAAQTYFDKNVEQLDLAESAMLAGITQSPEGKNPLRYPQEAKERQRYALSRMAIVGFITKEQAQAATDEILNIVGDRPNPNITEAPYFTEHVRRLLAETLGEESLYNDGWKIYTTVDLEAQKAADAAVARGLWEYARRRGFRGPVLSLMEAEIDKFRDKIDKQLYQGTMLPHKLYQAVILEVYPEKSSLLVAVGAIEGQISKKNLEWILAKGPISKQLKHGDVIWCRLDNSPKLEKKDGQKESPTQNQEKPSPTRLQAKTLAELDSNLRPMILEQRTELQAALISMDLKDGGVKAMVGGRDFSESQFNRAIQSQRQPGSSFKPIIYASAMDNGFTPGSVMIDGPVVIDDPGSGLRWKPLNSDQKFNGPMTLYSALVASRNLISIKILDRIGFEALDQTAKSMGIQTPLPHVPPVALGAQGLTMPEMLTAYSSFPNNGLRVEPRYIDRIEDRYGRVVANFEPVFYQALDPGTACELTFMLRGVVEQGTGRSVKPLNRPVGGKTGTTNDASDAWFVGFTPELVTAVWMGTDTPRPRAVGEVGGRAAGPVFLYYMQDALKDKPIIDFTVPPQAQLTPGGAFGICYKNGAVGTGYSELTQQIVPEEDFLRSDLTMEEFNDHQPSAYNEPKNDNRPPSRPQQPGLAAQSPSNRPIAASGGSPGAPPPNSSPYPTEVDEFLAPGRPLEPAESYGANQSAPTYLRQVDEFSAPGRPLELPQGSGATGPAPVYSSDANESSAPR
ncbi:MAG: PBP1A family penicillin-binding protein, partial [Deltaproteobacteria bacterium]|nr:PBP1A family penicillin-binding protein [Deltaproteobacteria bacterium]